MFHLVETASGMTNFVPVAKGKLDTHTRRGGDWSVTGQDAFTVLGTVHAPPFLAAEVAWTLLDAIAGQANGPELRN